MAKPRNKSNPKLGGSEVLILPDGRVLAHNVTPAFTEVLHHLHPEEPQFAARQAVSAGLAHRARCHRKSRAHALRTDNQLETSP